MSCFVAGDERSLILKKVEPWNSVRVTFNIPVDAAERLRELARHPNSALRELGVLAVQIGSDHVMSLSDGDNSSNADAKLPDVIAGSCSQANCQSFSSVVFSGSEKTSGRPIDSTVQLQQFKMPTLTVPSCCPSVLPPASGAVRNTAVEHPVHDIMSNLGNVAQPRPIGLVRWPGVIAGCPGSDAVAVRFAVPSVPVKEFSQGLCFISPLRAAVNQSIASSSPLLVNLLQTQRQQGIATVPCQPVVPLDTGALVLPQKRRRNSSTRKAKQLRNDEEPVVSVSSLQLIANSTVHMAPSPIFPLTATFAAGSTGNTTPVGNCPAPMQNEKVIDESWSEESGGARRMINPYTGDLELVDVADDDGLNVSAYSSTEISASPSYEASTETAIVKSTALLNSEQHVMTVSGLPSSIPNRLISPAVKVSESGSTCAASGELLTTSGNIPHTQSPTISSLVSRSTVASTLWHVASQSDKQNYLQCDTAGALLLACSVNRPKVVEGVRFPSTTVPGENLGIGSSSIKTENCRLDDSRSLTMNIFSASGQPLISSVPKTSTVAVPCLESIKLNSCSDGIPPQSTIPQLSTSQTDLIQMAFNLAKQNGNALHASSLVDNWTKNAGLLQSGLQSLHNIAVTTASIAFHSLSTATTSWASCTQSRMKDSDSLSSTTTVVSSDKCFFPAVSCFPPEHRRKPAVNIAGFGISPEAQQQTGTAGVVSSLASTLPAVKMLTSTTVPLEAKTCVISVVPSTTSSQVAANTSMGAESSLPFSGTEQASVPNTDVKKSIPLLTNLAPSSWPLMPNLLTVPLVNPAPLSGSPLLHCVTRAPLTPDGKLAGLGAAVTNSKGSIVPLGGRFCISLSSSQAAPVTSSADKQNIESTVVSGIRPHAIMLTDNLARFKLSVPSTAGKTPAKQGSSKDRRGSSTRTDDSAVQRGSGKSHLTVAQLLDMAKNARLQQTICDDEHVNFSEHSSDPSSLVVTSASLQPQPALTKTPPKNLLQFSSVPLQSSSVLLASHNQSQAQLVSVRLSNSVAGSSDTSTASSLLPTSSANPVCSQSSSSGIISQPVTTVVTSTLSSHLLAQPLNTGTNFSIVSGHLNAAPADVPGKVSIESALGSDCLALNALSSSASPSLPISAYSMQPPLPITSPRYPLNLTESVKKAMRGVGLYPSPPVSPTTPMQTFGSVKLPEIRPYPVSITCSGPVSELSTEKFVHDQSILALPVLSNLSSSAAMSCVSRYSPLEAPVTSVLQQALTTANKNTQSVISTTVCAEVIEKQTVAKNDTIVSQSDIADVPIAPFAIAVGSTPTTDCVQTCTSLSVASQSSNVQPESTISKCYAYISTVGPTVTRSVPNLEQLSSVHIENSSFYGYAISSHNNPKDSLHIAKTVNCLNGGLSASSGDSDMELRPDILEGLSSVETDAGFSSLHSSPCSAELANVLDFTKETNTAVANSTEVFNCVTLIDHRHSHDAVPSNACLTYDGSSYEGGLSLHCDRTDDNSYIKAASLACDISAASVDDGVNQEIAMAASSVDIPCKKAAADSSFMSSKYTLLKRNKLETDVSSISIRSTARRKKPIELDTNSSVASDSSNIVDPASDQHGVTSVRCTTRMATRSSQRVPASVTELVNTISTSNQTKTVIQKMSVKSPDKGGLEAFESSNHTPDLDTTKSVVAQRRSTRIPIAKVMDFKKSEAMTVCQDTDSGIGLRSRRQAHKVISVNATTPQKRATLRGMGVSKEDMCLGDSTENGIGLLDRSAGIEINVNDHEGNR